MPLTMLAMPDKSYPRHVTRNQSNQAATTYLGHERPAPIEIRVGEVDTAGVGNVIIAAMGVNSAPVSRHVGA